MSRKSKSGQYACLHLAWMVCLYNLLRTVERCGIKAIESGLVQSEYGGLFNDYPQTGHQPYRDFAIDLLKLVVDGLKNPNDLLIYSANYLASLNASKSFWRWRRTDGTVIKTISVMIWAHCRGYSRYLACEFARQAIPAGLRPSASELEALLHDINEGKIRGEANKCSKELEIKVDDFISTLTHHND